MEATHPTLVRTRLSAMMFLEFFIWGSWGFALTGYADKLGFTGAQIGWLMAIPALGAIIAPLFVGMIADRFFPAQLVLAALHVAGGACLIGAGFQDQFPMLMTLMMLYGLFFFPTLALCNAVAFKHIPDAAKFPRIAVFGTIGWIVAVLIADAFLGGTSTPKFLIQAGVASIVLGIYCTSLPNTPPKGAEAGSSDVFGLHALKLLKESSFLIFIICVFLATIPACGYFFALAAPMLQQRDYPSPLALTTLNQFAEIIFMFSMPWFVAKLGLKRVLMLGMAAWAVRYVCFGLTAVVDFNAGFTLALIGLLLHGTCYSFLYVGAYMYIDKVAPADMKASAQSLLTFLLIGVAWFLGAKGAGLMKDQYAADVPGIAAVKISTGEETVTSLPAWTDPNAADSAFKYLDLSGTVKRLMNPDEKAEPPVDLPKLFDANGDGKITIAEIDAYDGPEFELGGMKFEKDDLKTVFEKIYEIREVSKEDGISRDDWMAVQVNKWQPIWLYPSIGLFAILAFFAIAFRPKDDEEKTAEKPAVEEKEESTEE